MCVANEHEDERKANHPLEIDDDDENLSLTSQRVFLASGTVSYDSMFKYIQIILDPRLVKCEKFKFKGLSAHVCGAENASKKCIINHRFM